MLNSNIEEYKILRQEMASIKECITNYIGFTIGSAGASVVFMSIIVKGSPENPHIIIYSCLALSMLVSCVCSILFYKFNSHNRFAGYCKLLSHELAEESSNKEVVGGGLRKSLALFSWEIVLERLRYSDYNREILADFVKIPGKFKLRNFPDEDRKLLVRIIEIFSGESSWKHIRGWLCLMNAFIGKIKTRSWGFPPIPSVLLAFLSFSFLFAAIISVYYYYYYVSGTKTTMPLMASIVVFLLQLFFWNKCVGKLHELIDGAATVQSYFWRFIPVRVAFLNQHNIIPEYYELHDLMMETVAPYDKGKQTSARLKKPA